MASVTDVEEGLTTFIASVLYPTSTPPSILGYPIKIYAGWPTPQDLDIDMVETQPGFPTAAHVSVYALPGGKNTTRYPPQREENPQPAATYTLSANAPSVTVGGQAPNPYFAHNLAVFVNGKAYVVQAADHETPAQLASALQAKIVADVAGTTVLGAVITLPATAKLGATRVGVTGSVSRLVAQQERQFQICDWSSNPASRAAVGDAYLPALQDVTRLKLTDGSIARVRYHGEREDDFSQKQRIYRRFHLFTVEYATIITEAAAAMVAGQVDVSAADGTPLSTTFS